MAKRAKYKKVKKEIKKDYFFHAIFGYTLKNAKKYGEKWFKRREAHRGKQLTEMKKFIKTNKLDI